MSDLSVRSVGEIARELGVPLHRVEYVVRSRSIRPTVVAGGRKLYNDDVVAIIAAALQQNRGAK